MLAGWLFGEGALRLIGLLAGCVCSEAHFTVDFLCQDTFLRSYMDEAGYVPIAFVCNFPAVA